MDAANQNQSDLTDEAGSRRKSPYRLSQFRPKTPLQIEAIEPKCPKTRSDQTETSIDKADSDQKGFPQKGPGSDRKASYRWG